jgi:hypothetical protein
MTPPELNEFRKAVLAIFGRLPPGEKLRSRQIGEELPQKVIDEAFKYQADHPNFDDSHWRVRRRRSFVANRLGPRLSSMVRAGLLVKEKEFPGTSSKRYLWSLGPISDLLKERGEYPEEKEGR